MQWMQSTLFIVVVLIFAATAVITLMGVSGKIQVEKHYLNLLVAGLLIEVAAAVVFLFKSIDFQEMSASEFIAGLPEQVQADNSTGSRDQIRALVQDLQAQAMHVSQLQGQIAQKEAMLLQYQSDFDGMNGQIESLDQALVYSESELQSLMAFQDHFLIRLVQFHVQASRIGTTLNFTYPASKAKQELAKVFLELMAELGYYQGNLVEDADQAKEILIKYQQRHGFQKPGWYSRYTFRVIANEYLGIGDDPQLNIASGE